MSQDEPILISVPEVPTDDEIQRAKTSPKTVLVAVDGSPVADLAFRTAMTQTTPKDKVIVYHGEFLGTSLQGDGRFTTTEEPYAAKNSAMLSTLYAEECKRWDRHCVFYNHKLLGGAGTVAKSICETAAKHDVETVYVGSRGLSAPSRLFLGSVSWAALNRCDCNVMVVKDKFLAYAEAAAVAERLSQDAPLPIV